MKNPFRIWGKKTPTSFSPVTSANVDISPKNFLNFSFNPFATLVQNCYASASYFYTSASSNLLNLNQEHTSKELVFLVKYL